MGPVVGLSGSPTTTSTSTFKPVGEPNYLVVATSRAPDGNVYLNKQEILFEIKISEKVKV